MSSKRLLPYVRVAQLSELSIVSTVLTRAFTNDPAMNWYCCVQKSTSDINSPTQSEQRTMRNLHWLQTLIAKATLHMEGLITIVALPLRCDNDAAQAENTDRTRNTAQEEVVAVALWLPPGKTLDGGPISFIRCGILKALYGCGFTGMKVCTLILCYSI